jgi:hypothetical protein
MRLLDAASVMPVVTTPLPTPDPKTSAPIKPPLAAASAAANSPAVSPAAASPAEPAAIASAVAAAASPPPIASPINAATSQGILFLLTNTNDHSDPFVFRIICNPMKVLVVKGKDISWHCLKAFTFKLK